MRWPSSSSSTFAGRSMSFSSDSNNCTATSVQLIHGAAMKSGYTASQKRAGHFTRWFSDKFKQCSRMRILRIGVNAAGVAGVATPPNILTSVFSLQRNFWIPQVAVIFICNAPSVQFLIQQSMGHVNVKNNIPRMHHVTPFWDEKFINFLGRGTVPPQTPPSSPPTAPRFSRLRRSTCDPPMFQWRWRPWLYGFLQISKKRVFNVFFNWHLKNSLSKV